MINTYNASPSERATIVVIGLVSLAVILYGVMTTELPRPIPLVLVIFSYAFSRIMFRFAYTTEVRMLANSRVKPLSMWPKIVIFALMTAGPYMVIPHKELFLFCFASMWAAVAMHLKKDVFQD